jgi:hypothetical protein
MKHKETMVAGADELKDGELNRRTARLSSALVSSAWKRPPV